MKTARFYILFCLILSMFCQNAQAQQVVNGSFESIDMYFGSNGGQPLVIDHWLRDWDLTGFDSGDGLFNYYYPYQNTDSNSFACGTASVRKKNGLSNSGGLVHLKYDPAVVSGIPLLYSVQTQDQIFTLSSLQNKVWAFHHPDTVTINRDQYQGYGYPPVIDRYSGHSSLKLALHYSIPLQPGQPYLLSFFDCAGDSLASSYTGWNYQPYYQRVDSFVV